MKKLICGILASGMLLGSLAGCSGEKASPPKVEVKDNKEERLVIKEITATPDTPQKVNTDIKISVTASESEGLMYQFYIKTDKDSKWKFAQKYSDSNELNWTPTEPGEYQFLVNVKNENGKKATKQISYSIKK
jgi:Y_Y_Y domain